MTPSAASSTCATPLLGYASALVPLAEMYENGRDTDVDPVRALELYDVAASLGDAKARYRADRLRALLHPPAKPAP